MEKNLNNLQTPIHPYYLEKEFYFLKPDLVKEFHVDIHQSRIDAIIAKVMQTKLPLQMPPSHPKDSLWETGADIKWMEELQLHWIQKFKWEEAQKRLNQYPQYMAKVDDHDIHFYLVRGEGENPLPLILTHGSPGSVVEFLDCIGPLTRPSEHGGKEEDAFTVIIPSLPGFGFSSMPKAPIQAKTTAKLWHKLMTEIIGFDQYAAQGGDIGAVVAVQLAYLYPEHLKAIHLNLPLWFHIPETELSETEKNWLKESQDNFNGPSFDYLRLQMNKPMMLGIGLNDSPMGTAAWIAEKFWSWVDHSGKLESVISKDDLLTNIMLYLLSEGGIAASFWYSRAYITELNWNLHPAYIEVPTAVAIYPGEDIIGKPPLQTVKRGYNLVDYVEIPRGGHFAAMEQPQLFSANIRDALRHYR